METKTCSRCQTEKLVDEFNRNRATKDGLFAWCRFCQSEHYSEWWAGRDEILKANKKKGALRFNYGISPEMLDLMYEQQEGCCAICGDFSLKPFQVDTPGKEKVLHIDHDHETGEVRELLCHNCNKLLGHAHDDSRVLIRALAYLEKHSSGQRDCTDKSSEQTNEECDENTDSLLRSSERKGVI